MKGMDQASMPGMDMAPPASATQSSQSMPNMDMQDHSQHGATPQAAHAGMDMTGTALPAGDAPAPPPPSDPYADRLFPKAEMDRAPAKTLPEQERHTVSPVMLNMAAHPARSGPDEMWLVCGGVSVPTQP